MAQSGTKHVAQTETTIHLTTGSIFVKESIDEIKEMLGFDFMHLTQVKYSNILANREETKVIVMRQHIVKIG